MSGRAEPARFVDLFLDPTVEKMHSLSPSEFEKFVAYVLRRAGFTVTDVALRFLRGVDLEMYSDKSRKKQVGGVEVKRFEATSLVNAATVQKLMGAPAVRRNASTAYLVTTSSFNSAAYEMARNGKGAALLTGEQLVRYIRYLHESRYDDIGEPAIIPPDAFAGQASQRSRSVSGTRILAVANNKGGVGKTITAYHFGTALATMGQRVLMIDLDPQANLSEALLNEVELDKSSIGAERIPLPHIVQYFSGERTLSQLIRPTRFANVSAICSHASLRLRDLGGAGRPHDELMFVSDLHSLCGPTPAGLDSPFDWIILDTPPALSRFTRIALAAAEYIIVPARPRSSSVAGTMNLFKTLAAMDALVGTPATVIGSVVTHWDDLASSEAEITNLNLLLGVYKSRVLRTQIPVDNQLERAKPTQHTRGVEAYQALVKEVLTYVGDDSV